MVVASTLLVMGEAQIMGRLVEIMVTGASPTVGMCIQEKQ
jgi:hypothetical protein